MASILIRNIFAILIRRSSAGNDESRHRYGQKDQRPASHGQPSMEKTSPARAWQKPLLLLDAPFANTANRRLYHSLWDDPDSGTSADKNRENIADLRGIDPS